MEKWVDYRIFILHERPEFGEGVEFLATYYARETKDVRCIEKAFRKAFMSAHPSWIIKKVTVEAKP